MKLDIHSQTSPTESTPVNFENGKIIYPTLYDGCKYLSMLGIKLIHANKKEPLGFEIGDASLFQMAIMKVKS